MQMDQRSRRKRLRAALLPVAAILVILLAVQLLYGRRRDTFVQLSPVDGVLDLTGVDVSHEIFTIANDWNFYPEKLYESDDFAAGVEPSSEVSASHVPYGTHRLVLVAEPHQYYSICGYSTDYCSRILVDGTEAASFGHVADNAAEAVAKTGYQTIPLYTGEDGRVEVICQYANFVHKDGGTIHATYLSTPQNIEDYKTGNTVVSVALGGGLLVLALYFLLCAAMLRQRSYVLLAFCCLLFSLRDQLFAFICLMPNLPWSVGYRMHLAVVNLLPASILFLLGDLFPTAHPWVRRIYGGVTALFLLLLAVLDTKVLVTVNVLAYGCAVPYLIYLLWQLIGYLRKPEHRKTPDLILLFGFGLLFASVIAEGILTRHNSSMVRYGMSPGMMLLFVFLVAFSIGLRVQAREVALAESRSRSVLLERMNILNLDYLHKVAHELKTPLTVISGYAQLTDLQLATGHVNEETPENLKTIHLEALRLAEIVTRLLEYSQGKPQALEFEPVPVLQLLKNVQAVCTPICLKNNNSVLVSGVDETIWGSREMLLQIFVNLAVNANRHTHDGTITITAEEAEDRALVLFRVADTGSGINPDCLSHLFEQGCSADGGSGLGLAICAEAVEAHGGRIWVENTGPEGTVFAFTVTRTEEKYEHHSIGRGQSSHYEN